MSAEQGRTTYKFRQLSARLRAKRLPCWLCRQPIDYEAEPDSPDAYTVDHVRPLSTHPELAEIESNMRPAHRHCNLSRSNRDPRPDLGRASREW